MPLVHLTSGYNLMLTSAQTTVSLSLVSITGLSFPCQPNEVWDVDFSGQGQGGSGTNGMIYGISGPAGATIAGYFWSSSINQSAANLLKYGLNAFGTIGNCHVGATAAYRDDEGRFRILVGPTAGTIQLQFAAITSGTAAINALSVLRASRSLLV